MGHFQENRKIAIRQALLARRARLGAGVAVARSFAVCRAVLGLPAFAAARHLVTYEAIGNEVDPGPLASEALRRGIRLYRPARDVPAFRAVDGDREPPPGPSEGVLILVPGVGFDVRGVRLGRGGGWYDRALGGLPDAYRLGLAFDFQLVSDLPEAPWDVRVHAVVTESRVLWAGKHDRRHPRENQT